MNYRVYLIITLVYFAMPLHAQDARCRCKVEGQVVDSLSGQSISGSSISIMPLNKTASSDEHGHFTLSRLCQGEVVLTVNALGYQTYKRQLRLNSDQEISLRLQRAEVRLGEVEIRASTPAGPGANVASTISKKQLEQSRGGTLADALKTVPGVTSLQTGSTIAKPVIQGLHSNRLLILNNGIRQEGQQWGMEHGPEIDPFVAQTITVIKGAEGVRFGPEAIGGVILVKPAPLSKLPGLQGELNLAGSTNGAGGAVSGRLEGGVKAIQGLGWRLQGTMKTSGNVKTADYYMNNTGTSEVNFSGALGYSHKKLETDIYFSHFHTEIGIFGGSHIGNKEDLQAAMANGRPFSEGEFSYQIDAPRQQVSHRLLKVESHFHLSNNSHIDLVYGLQQNKRQEYDIRRGGRSGIPSLDLALNTQTLDLFLESMNGSGWKQIAGINGLLQVNNNVPGTLATPLIPNYDTYNAGLYYISQLHKNNYQLEAGVRYDYKYLDALGYDRDQNLYGGSRKFNNASGSLGAALYISPQWTLRSNLATAWRPPVVSELYSNGLHHGSATVEIGDDNLVSEKSYKWISSAEHRGEKFSFDISVFINRINNYIYLEPSGELYESIRGVFPTFHYRQTDANLSGADLAVKYQLSNRFEYGLKGAFVRAKDTNNETFLPWIPSDRLENTLGYRWKGIRKKTESYLILSHQFAARQHRYTQGSDFAPPPPAYHLLGLQAGTDLKFGKTILNVNASVSNLANKLYKDYMNRFRYYAHDQGRNLALRATLKF